MTIINYLIWATDPEIFVIPLSKLGLSDRPVVWYGLLFALGFILSQQVLYRIFKADGQDEKDVDTLTTYMVLATILGARLGHCLFYNPSYYLSNPIEILKVWEGGLASHGGAIGIFIALWIYANYEIKSDWVIIIPKSFNIKKRKKPGQSYYWILDRLAIVVCLTGALIRTGNLMNSEMEGLETNSDYGLVYAKGSMDVLRYNEDKIESVTFRKGGEIASEIPGRVPITAVVKYQRGVEFNALEKGFVDSRLGPQLKSYREAVEHIDFGDRGEPLNYKYFTRAGHHYLEISGVGIVRHPAQMYEALSCLLIMTILFWLWKTKRDKIPEGLMFGIFMTLLWSFRFIDEFFKMNQEAFEDDLPLNMGQWLSIPGLLVGLLVVITTLRNHKTSAL